jgi:LAO/AO transport system kinase
LRPSNYICSVRRHPLSIEQFVKGIRAGDRAVLGQAITLVESTRPDHQALAQELIARLLADESAPHSSLRIGITGAPGAGKSTLIEALGTQLVASGKRVAVLAIDPTSSVSRGSILGDKTRMEQLSANERAFIRPSPAGDSLGGVARKTRESILLVEAAGFDTIIIETVGVGQSEVAAQRMTDVFLLLLLPGAGDELQGIKRGIVEMADILVVNKADGERTQLANQARVHYLNATHLLPPKPSLWPPRVLTCSALEGRGIAELWQAIEAYRAQVLANGFFQQNRQQQARHWLHETLETTFKSMFYVNILVKEKLARLEPEVLAGRVSPFAAASEILKTFEGKFFPNQEK